ncbi:TylF/MycF/NovP-related O-methyltransferase [Sphingomonas sp. URHD0057]|uniref:TylF/MycF/NovP-related O-methyltransferase n=1 Tax=Sphingomonas sp. URHD0057 TaxID=1380389 RepID=UPI000688DFDE|nr:TylF/MycF/NovP-related O-methyltransferase [Sphingomonas sp. URHD0057]
MRAYLARYLTALGAKLSGTPLIPELGASDRALLGAVEGLSMTSPIAQWELIQAIRHIEANGILGDIVECGVWRGGNLVLAGLLRKELGFERAIWAFDTFSGMTAPTAADFKPAESFDVPRKHAKLQRRDRNQWCLASEAEVLGNFKARVGNDRLKMIKGPVEETLGHPENLPGRIAILRLDTDFYESTKTELEALYPRLSSGGVLIIDDYGEWAGARKAVDEYFAEQKPWLHYVTHTVRLMIKP